MRQFGLSLLLLMLVLGGLTAEASAQGSDQIYPYRGSPVTGIIMNVSNTEVVYDSRGSQSSFAVNEIKRIAFADDTPALRRAREDVLEGQLTNGLDELRKIDPSTIGRDLVVADLQYYIAYCQGRLALSGGGDKAAASAAMLNFVRANPNTFHFFEAAQLLGDLAAGQQNYADAIRYYKAIGAKAPWPGYQMLASVLEGRALVAEEKYEEAQAKFASVVANTVDTPEAAEQKLFAQVGIALCMAETRRQEDGKKLLEGIIAENDASNVELFGRAYNALGRCHLKANKTKDALLAYLHVHVLFYSVPETHAEALYFLSKLWQDVNQSERAVEMRTLLKERYSGSAWAKRG